MKKQKSKKNGIIAAVITLSSVSLVSVGFASWIISGGYTASVQGTISAEQVSDVHYKIQLHVDYSENGKVTFDKNIVYGPKSETANHNWLKIDGTSTENLEAEAKFWVANIAGTAQDTTNKNVLVKNSDSFVKMYALTIDGTHEDAFEKEVDNKRLFGELPTPELTVDTSVTKNDFGDQLTYYEVTAKVKFTWGEYFGGNNPYKYFNDQPYSAEIGAKAKEILGYVYAINGATYSTTIKTGGLID